MESKRERQKMLDYRLTDVLEMNCSKHVHLIKEIKAKLFARPLRDFNLYPLNGFVLDRVLVVIQNGRPRSIHELYLLNAHRGSLRKISISREENSNGKISNELLRFT